MDLGDVAIYRQLVESLGLSSDQQEQMFSAVQTKSSKEIGILSARFGLTAEQTALLSTLPGLSGGMPVLGEAKLTFSEYPGIINCLNNLQRVVESIMVRYEDIDVYLDLSELRGYAYHTGIVFAAYVKNIRHVVAKGGRYDHVGEVFGRKGRGATGFSINVRNIADETAILDEGRPTVVVASESESGLWQEVTRLRHEGYTVVESGEVEDYDYALVYKNGSWELSEETE